MNWAHFYFRKEGETLSEDTCIKAEGLYLLCEAS